MTTASLLYYILWPIYCLILSLCISLLYWRVNCLLTIRVSIKNTSIIIYCSLLLGTIIHILLLFSSYTIYSITRVSYTLYISRVIVLLLVLIHSLYILCPISYTIIVSNWLSRLQSYSPSTIHYLILYQYILIPIIIKLAILLYILYVISRVI